MPLTVAQAAAGAIYGTATGVVLALVARRGGLEGAHRTGRRHPGWLLTVAGLAAFLVLGIVGVLGFARLGA